MKSRESPGLLVAVSLSLSLLSGCAGLTDTLSFEAHEKKGLDYLSQGKYQQAQNSFKMALSMSSRQAGPKAGVVGRLTTGLADAYMGEKKYDQAADSYERASQVFKRDSGLLSQSDRGAWSDCLKHYAALLRETGRAGEAEAMETQSQLVLSPGREEEPVKDSGQEAPATVAPDASTAGRQSASESQPAPAGDLR